MPTLSTNGRGERRLPGGDGGGAAKVEKMAEEKEKKRSC